jgi:dihydrofolate reductase
VAERRLAGLVGRRSSVSRAGIRTDTSREAVICHEGTTFQFVTGGIHEALDRAKEAARAKDVRLGGGVETIRQYLRALLIDELHFAIAPVLLGRGEHLLSGIDLLALGYRVSEHVSAASATHVVLTRAPD